MNNERKFFYSELRKKHIPIPNAIPIFLPGAGVEMGLTFVIDHDNNDYTYFLNSNQASFIYVFDPFDYPIQSSGALTESIINPGQELFMSIYPQHISGTESMRTIPPESRGCVFPDERTLNEG